MVNASAHAAAPMKTAAPVVQRVMTADGLSLAVESFGPPDGAPLLFAHGFGQSRLAWTRAAEQLAEAGYRCLTMDGRGHGDSAWHGDHRYDLDQFVADAAQLAAAQSRKPIWIGASMGGLIGMLAQAGSAHGLFDALVLVDVTPRWEEAGVGRMLDFMRAHPDGFASVDEASAAVAHYLPHRAQRTDDGRLRKMLVPMSNGRLRWHWDPRLLEQVADNGSRYFARLEAAARRLTLPVLLISGGQSDIVSDQTIAEFQRLVPHAAHERIERATHMVVGDANDVFVETISRYVRSISTCPQN